MRLRWCAWLCAALVALVATPALGQLKKLKQYQKQCFEADACVMVLDRKEAFGCGQCTADSLTAEALEISQDAQLGSFVGAEDTQTRILVVPESVFFSPNIDYQRLSFTTNVAAVVVYEDDRNKTTFTSISADRLTPNEEFLKPPSSADLPVSFNRAKPQRGQFRYFPFNIFRVDKKTADIIKDKAATFNGNQSSAYPTAQYKLQSNGRMWACPENAAEQQLEEGAAVDRPGRYQPLTSDQCLEERTCLPLGGHSAWSSLDILGSTPDNKILAITAPMDSLAFFHSAAYGTGAEISSLAVLMAVAEAVGAYSRSEVAKNKTMVRQPVYFAWAGQTWGFSGSSRFLKDVEEFECEEVRNISQLNQGCRTPYMPSIRFKDFKGADFKVINVAGLVNPTLDPANLTVGPNAETFYFHSFRPDGEPLSELHETLVDSFNGTLNPGRNGTAPDASQSFSRYLSEAETVSIANYESVFTNKVYHSQYDDRLGLPKERRKPLTAAAEGLAKAVIRTSFGDTEASPVVNETIISDFIDCMTTNWSEVPCELAREYLGEDIYKAGEERVKPTNFASVFVPLARFPETNNGSFFKLTFVNTFLAYQNRFDTGPACKSTMDCGDYVRELNKQATNQSTLRVAFCSRGICVASDTYTHNAYGSGLNATNDAQSTFRADPESLGSGEDNDVPKPEDSMYTESYWDKSLSLCGLTEESQTFGVAILSAGIGVSLFSFFLALFVHCSLERKPEEAAPDNPSTV